MNDAQQTDILLQEYLTLEEQINLWYSSVNPELQKLAKYIERKLDIIKEEEYNEGYSNGLHES